MEAVNDRHVSQSHKIHDTTGTFACCGIPVKACGDDNDEDELSLELPDLSSVGFSWPGGKAGAAVRCFLRLQRRGAFGTRSKGTSCIPSKNEVSDAFVGSSLRIVLAPIAPFFVPAMCSGFVCDMPYQIPFSHAVSPLWSLFPDDNPRCQDLEKDRLCKRNSFLR